MGVMETTGLIAAISLALTVMSKLADGLLDWVRHRNGRGPEETLSRAADKLSAVAAKLDRLCDLQTDLRDTLRTHDEKLERAVEGLHRRLDVWDGGKADRR